MAPPPTNSPVRGGPRRRDPGVARPGRWLCPVVGLWLVALGQACLAPADNFVASGAADATSPGGSGDVASEVAGTGAGGTGSGGREASSAEELETEGTGATTESTEVETSNDADSEDETGLSTSISDDGSATESSTVEGTGDVTDPESTATSTEDDVTGDATDSSEASENTTETGDSSENDPTDTSGDTETSTTDDGSETSGTSDEVSTDAEETEDGSGTGTMECQRQMCAGYNIAATADDSLNAIGHFIGYPIQLGPDVEQILGVEVFTGEVVGDNAFSVWTDLAARPFLEIQRVPWRSALEKGWQGTDFPRPVDVVPGSVVWVVWHSLAGVQANVAVGGTVTLAKVSTDSGGTWVDNETPRAAMLKVYCCVAGGAP